MPSLSPALTFSTASYPSFALSINLVKPTNCRSDLMRILTPTTLKGSSSTMSIVFFFSSAASDVYKIQDCILPRNAYCLGMHSEAVCIPRQYAFRGSMQSRPNAIKPECNQLAYCLLPIAYCLLPIADSPCTIIMIEKTLSKLMTSDSGLKRKNNFFSLASWSESGTSASSTMASPSGN